jgi:hypothetical protein
MKIPEVEKENPRTQNQGESRERASREDKFRAPRTPPAAGDRHTVYRDVTFHSWGTETPAAHSAVSKAAQPGEGTGGPDKVTACFLELPTTLTHKSLKDWEPLTVKRCLKQQTSQGKPRSVRSEERHPASSSRKADTRLKTELCLKDLSRN